MAEVDPQFVSQALRSKRFLAASRASMSVEEIATWDRHLVRELRLLVPIDVQALAVEPGSTEEMVRLPMLLAGTTNADARTLDNAMPGPFADGEPRPAGVHLHWAMPDALLRGRLETRDDGTSNRLGLPVLPDRWVVLRVLLPVGATQPHVRGWVLEADRAVAVPLESWAEGSPAAAAAQPAGEVLQPGQLTGTVGGSAAWAGVYDAVGNRFAFHDPLDDLAEAAPSGVDRDAGAYVVAGWWHDPASDPLDKARSGQSLHELLEALRWRLLGDWGDARWLQAYNESLDDLRSPLGLKTGDRFSERAATVAKVSARASAASAFTPVDKVLTEPFDRVVSSKFAAGAGKRYVTTPWHLRSSLLHGAVYGVPLGATPAVDRRPSPDQVRVALGEHDGDVLAALSTVPGTAPDRRRDAERLLEAFAAQKVNRLGSPDGTVEIEEHEHGTAFTSLPAGSAGTDRFLQRSSPGQAGATVLSGGIAGGAGTARRAAPFSAAGPPAAGPAGAAGAASVAGPLVAKLAFSADKIDLVPVVGTEILQYQWARRPITLPPAEPRVVDRPAARFAFPADPMVAVQGAGRSLRHANDGRASADGKLTCRWPTQVVSEVQGVVAGHQLIASLGNGSVPPEVVSLAREVALHDPYHSAWLAAAAAPRLGMGSAAGVRIVHQRLVAEVAVRFGTDAVFDGTTSAFADVGPGVDRGRKARARRMAIGGDGLAALPVQRARVFDQLLSFSLVKGADPDPVGVTCWSQPWVPLWLEWEVTLDGPASPTIDGWQLGPVDLDPAPPGPAAPPVAAVTRTFQGRSLLTTGASTTLHRAVDDWLAVENARDAADPTAGEADEPTEAALADLARAVTRADMVTAALDGVRIRLLGLPHRDGVQRPIGPDGTVTHPAPTDPPTLLAPGALRLTKARLLDAFGRTLKLPVGDAVTVTVRDSLDGAPGALSVPPRITRPARWQFRLVEAATVAGVEGVEARVDQVDPTLQVNPVAGFLLPDHLDESLEVFGAGGSPLGELLHEPVGGGVVWEIAAGREGPPDAGPLYGLSASEQALGALAAGLVAADAAHRGGGPATEESALSALLRAIDTTLWTVDSFASLGSEHVAGLVGRPVAVVRAQLRLELRPPDDVDLSNPAHAAEWAAAERDLAAVAFPVRIGELTRTDDGVLGFFVDDDWSRFRPVDKAVAALAAESGRSKGQLGLLKQSSPSLPPATTITHPYVAGEPGTVLGDSDTLFVHLGQTATLTLLMHPAGKVHLTSGILPRKALALARDWVGPGLAAIAPSLRTGPVLVETDLAEEGRVRLPKVSVFGKDQAFLWRDTPGSWRTDAILAATQTALLPDTPAEVREGWIRVVPPPPPGAAEGEQQ